MSIDKALTLYKAMINFDDQMEKNNFKFVSWYVQYEKKRGTSTEKELVRFVFDAIDIHDTYIRRGRIH